MHTAHFEPKEPPFLSKDVQAELEHFISLMKERFPSISGFTLLNGPIELASANELFAVLTEKDGYGLTLGHIASHNSACLQTYLSFLETSVASDRLDKAALLTVLTKKNNCGHPLGHYASFDSGCLQTYLDWLTKLVTNGTFNNAELFTVLTEKDGYGLTLDHTASHDSGCLQTYLGWLTKLVANGTLTNAELLRLLTVREFDGNTKSLSIFGLLRALIETSTGVESTCTALTLGCERLIRTLIRTDANDTAAIEYLAAALQSEHCPEHLKLDLRNTNLSMVEARLLLRTLQSPQCPPYLKLDLSWNPGVSEKLQTQIKKLLNEKQLHATQRACLMFLRGFADGQNPLAKLDFDVTEVILTNLFQSMGLAERDAKNQAKMAEKLFKSMNRIQESRCHAKAVQDGEKEARRQGLHLANVGFYARSLDRKGKAPQGSLPRQALPALITSRLKPSNGLLVIDYYLVESVEFSARGMEIHFHSELGAKQFKQEFPKYFAHGSLMEAKCVTLPTAALINQFIEKECKLDPEKVYNSENLASSANAPVI